jgi:perosamine synthetase
MEKLAIFGGAPALSGLAKFESLGSNERKAIERVVNSQVLSGFYGSPGPEFNGGEEVQKLETKWRQRYSCSYAISVNSATSGLIAALAAIELEPGEEVIVPPWTMSATVVAPLFVGGIPVFVDIEEDTFCLDPEKVEEAITSRTRAIIAVNLFGHPAQLATLRKIADRHGIFLIEDNSQSPLASENGTYCGTVGDIGVFSLNYHKFIHCGEGGVCVTDSESLAGRMRLFRNHGENIAGHEGGGPPFIGQNLRMTELSAAVAAAQLEDIDRLVEAREQIAIRLTEGTRQIEGWRSPKVRDGCRHNYYCWAVRIDERTLGIKREKLIDALIAEGVPISAGYVEPLYKLPVFRERRTSSRSDFPFNLTSRDYNNVACPVAERLHQREILIFETCSWYIDNETMGKLVSAILKVIRYLPRSK